MEIKILQVFLGKDGLPYKDQERTVHFPIVGNGFQGANNTTQVKFYFGQLGDSNTTWVAVSKLPNGRIGSKVLETYDDANLGEPYALLQLDSFYTQYKGDVYISLQGYEGGVNVTYNSETELYEIHGTPTIQATGSIKFSNNYATQFVGSGEEENADLQALMAALGLKANASETYTRYTGAFGSVTLQTLFNRFEYQAFLLNDGTSDFLMQFEINDSNTYAIRMVDLTSLKTWYAQIGSGTNQLPLSSYVSALATNTYLSNITTQEYVVQNYVPYIGASTDVDLGINNLTAAQLIAKWNNNNYAVYNNLSVEIKRNGVSHSIIFPTLTKDETFAVQSFITDSYVPYSGATKDVNLGSHTLTVNEIDIGNSYYQIGLVGTDLVIGTGTGDIYLQPYGKLYYGSYEVADKNFTANTYVAKVGSGSYDRVYGVDHQGNQTVYNLEPDAATQFTIPLRRYNGHIPAGKVGDVFNNVEAVTKYYVDNEIQKALTSEITPVDITEYPTLEDFLDSTGQEGIIYLYPIDTSDLTKGYYRYVWEDNDWLDLGTTQIDLSDYYTKTETDTLLSAKANITNAVMDSDVTISGGYVTEINKGGTNYPLAQQVTLYTTPKVVATTSDLPESNDGYLYLVLDDGYLYYWNAENEEWSQGYEYVQDVSNFVFKTQTIAGIALSGNITAQALTDALVLASNSDVDNLF